MCNPTWMYFVIGTNTNQEEHSSILFQCSLVKCPGSRSGIKRKCAFLCMSQILYLQLQSYTFILKGALIFKKITKTKKNVSYDFLLSRAKWITDLYRLRVTT